jgi:hypothetical protein
MTKVKSRRKSKNKRTSRKKGSDKILDPFSSGFIVSRMLNDESLHNLARTSRKNIGINTKKELQKRKKQFEIMKNLERKMNLIEFTDNIERYSSSSDYTYEFDEFYYEWKEERGLDDDDDEHHEEAEQDFIMSYFYKRERYNTKYMIYCPSLTHSQINTLNINKFPSTIQDCLKNPKTKYYKLYDNNDSLEGGFGSMDKSEFKEETKLK